MVSSPLKAEINQCGSTNTRSVSSPKKMETKAKVHDDPEIEIEDFFEDHSVLGKRIGKTLYYAGRLPSTPRPSFPLTILAVNAFTSGTLGMELDTLEFLDLDMASEIGRNACVSPTVVMMALVYLDRLSKNNPNYLSTVKASELFVVALLVASKFVQDDGEQYGIYSSEWITPVGFDKKRLNQLEINFLSSLDWNVKVELEEFMATLDRVELALSCQESQRRHWMTYTEIHSISAGLSWESLWPMLYTYLIQVVTIASIGYVCIVMTLMTSYVITPQLVGFSQTLLRTVSNSQAEPQLIFQSETETRQTKRFADVPEPSLCQLNVTVDSLFRKYDLWDTNRSETYGTSRGNKTNYTYRGHLPDILPVFQPIMNPGRETVSHRQNHLFTIA